MKTREEIEQLAFLKYPYEGGIETNVTDDLRQGFIKGYTQCQEDMAKELEQLREAIRKNTWYDEDGNAQVNLHGIDNSSLNKQDNG